MSKLKTVLLSALLVGSLSQVGFAAKCDGFEIKIKNNLPKNLRVTRIQLTGADIQPRNVAILEANAEIPFIVSNSSKEMTGEIFFRTVTLPNAEIKILFKLRNGLIRCDFDNKTDAVSNGFAIDNSSLLGQRTSYTIG